MKNAALKVLLILTISSLILSAGCGSDDDDSPGGTEPGKNIAFTSDTQNPPDNSVYMDFVSASDTTLTFNINVKKVNDVYGAAFALHFNPEVFEYIASTEGDFFAASGGTTTYLDIVGSGVVTIGISLLGNEAQPVSGSGTVCTVVFRALENGQSRFDYQENRLLDNQSQAIHGVKWFGALGIVAD